MDPLGEKRSSGQSFDGGVPGLGTRGDRGAAHHEGILLAISGNQWTMMQTLTDAYMTRETALSNRTPLADVIADSSPWPDWSSRSEQNVTLGKMPGGRVVQASLTRFRVNIPGDPDSEANLNVFRLYSVLKYQIGEKEYVKSRSTLRMQ
jgi:hypothetical protein